MNIRRKNKCFHVRILLVAPIWRHFLIASYPIENIPIEFDSPPTIVSIVSFVVHPRDAKGQDAFRFRHDQECSLVKVALFGVVKEIYEGESHFFDGLEESGLVWILFTQILEKVQ